MYHLRTIEYDKQLCGFGKFRLQPKKIINLRTLNLTLVTIGRKKI